MPTKSAFVLKDSPEDVKTSNPNVTPKGRTYNGDIAKNKRGATKINEILLGTKLACIAITDDKEDTLKKVSKLNPWHEVAVTTITGSKKEAHKPLSSILDRHFGLKLDHHIDISKRAGGYRTVDTQGFIAHDDEIIVVSFRCTTSAFDWMTNLDISSSEWELEEDLAQGHSGYCSCFDGRFSYWFGLRERKPRVHTGFYNNILQVIPLLQEHVEPLLKDDQPPRTLYVVGHSLGAGLSTLATCYFLSHHDWATSPHRLLNISLGTPRACQKSMATLVEEKLAELSPIEKANVFRIVADEDAVCRIPSELTGYRHVGRTIFLTTEGEVLVNPKVGLNLRELGANSTQDLTKKLEESKAEATEEETKKAEDTEEKEEEDKMKTNKRERTNYHMPKPFRDHCPDCYLEPLVKLYEQEAKQVDAEYFS